MGLNPQPIDCESSTLTISILFLEGKHQWPSGLDRGLTTKRKCILSPAMYCDSTICFIEYGFSSYF
jgi:hypothetical protein